MSADPDRNMLSFTVESIPISNGVGRFFPEASNAIRLGVSTLSVEAHFGIAECHESGEYVTEKYRICVESMLPGGIVITKRLVSMTDFDSLRNLVSMIADVQKHGSGSILPIGCYRSYDGISDTQSGTVSV